MDTSVLALLYLKIQGTDDDVEITPSVLTLLVNLQVSSPSSG